MPLSRRLHRPVAAALAALGLLAGCAPASSPDADRPQVLAAFYPLQFVAERVGGRHVDVASLTPPGADPHSLELSPRQVRDIRDADVIVMLSGLQAATDEAMATGIRAHVVDAVGAAADDPRSGSTTGASDAPADLHFWLDPTRLARIVPDVADALVAADPDHAADYAAAAAALESDLAGLDAELTAGLAPCVGATVVSSHAAFGFLADRYGLEQVGITGVDPEVEPSPARLRAVRRVVEETGVRTLYFEVLADPEVTRVLADDLGVGTAVLDPLEGRTDADRDYLDTMHSNLEALRTGLTCPS